MNEPAPTYRVDAKTVKSDLKTRFWVLTAPA